MERTLSAGTTFLFKYLFPVVWIGGFGAGTLQLWLHPEDVVFNGVRGAASSGDQWMFLAAWVLGSAFILWMALPLKSVRLTDQGLRVSNYRREIAIPFGAIERVSQSRWINVRPVTVHLRHDSPFGRRVTFIPAGRRRFAFWREDEIVDELRHRAGLVRELSSQPAAV